MAQIKLEVTARRKRILEALCIKHDCTVEQLLEGKFVDLECNAAGLDLSESDEDQDAAVTKFENKAAKAKAAREVAKQTAKEE